MKEGALLLEMFGETVQANREAVYMFVRRLMNLARPFLLQSDIRDEFRLFSADPAGEPLRERAFGKMILHAQEAALDAPWLYLALRPSIARWSYLRIHAEALQLEEIDVTQFQQAKDREKSVGLTKTVGAQLRKQEAALPDVRKRRQNIRDRQQTMSSTRVGDRDAIGVKTGPTGSIIQVFQMRGGRVIERLELAADSETGQTEAEADVIEAAIPWGSVYGLGPGRVSEGATMRMVTVMTYSTNTNMFDCSPDSVIFPLYNDWGELYYFYDLCLDCDMDGYPDDYSSGFAIPEFSTLLVIPLTLAIVVLVSRARRRKTQD